MMQALAEPSGFYRLDPSQVAVVLVDFQNDFCSPEVTRDNSVTNTNNTATASRANEFAQQAAKFGAHIIYTKQILDFDHLTPRQQRWEQPGGLCAKGSWGAELYLEPVAGASVVTKYRFDAWQSQEFLDVLNTRSIDGLVICGVQLICCVLYAVLGASERGYHYLVPHDLVSGQDPGDETDNRAVRDFLRYTQPDRAIPSSDAILASWRKR